MDIIKIEERDGANFVDARAMHESLSVGRDFSNWIKERIEKYSFYEGIDFQKCSPDLASGLNGGQNKVEYLLTVSMAKELAMVENNDKGREIRQYLIKLEQAWNTPDMVIARALQMSDRKIKELTDKVNQDRPKVAFFDAVTNSKDAIEMKDAAKVLNLGMGRTTLFKFLREKKIIMDNNTPYQEYIDRGYFRVIESKWVTPEGETKINLKTVVYQKGLDYIQKVAANA